MVRMAPIPPRLAGKPTLPCSHHRAPNPDQGFELHKENWDLVHSRDEGFPLPRMRGFHHDGTPDNSEPLDTPSAPGVSTAQFMTAPAFAAPRGLADAGAAGYFWWWP